MISEKYWFVEYPIWCIKEFYISCIKTVDEELDGIEKSNENGEYNDYGEYESAFSTPLKRQELIYYAVINELSILIDKKFRTLAFTFFKNEEAKKGYNGNSVKKNIEDYFRFYNEHFDKLIKYINKEYSINISKIKGYNQIKKIRDLNNAYKHRENHIHKNINIKPNSANIFARYFVFDENILELINDTKLFLENLFDLTKGKRIKQKIQ